MTSSSASIDPISPEKACPHLHQEVPLIKMELAHLAAAATRMEDGEDAEGGAERGLGFANLKFDIKRYKKHRCGECAGCETAVDCNQCKYCLDKPKLGGSNTLRRQCAKRVCINKASAGTDAQDDDVSAYTRECLSQALAHGKATAPESASVEEGLVVAPAPVKVRKAQHGTREVPITSGLPPAPIGKRAYTKSAPGRPTHTPYQKAVMGRFYELNKMPDTQEREALGAALGLTARAVQVWFQNRRQRQKEAKEAATLAPVVEASWLQPVGLTPPQANMSRVQSMDFSVRPQHVDLEVAATSFYAPPPVQPWPARYEAQAGTAPALAHGSLSAASSAAGFSVGGAGFLGTSLGSLGGSRMPSGAPAMEPGYGTVLLDAYVNLPAGSRAALPPHVLKLVVEAYHNLPLAQQAALPPDVIDLVGAQSGISRAENAQAEIDVSRARSLGLPVCDGDALQAARCRYEAALAWGGAAARREAGVSLNRAQSSSSVADGSETGDSCSAE